MVAMSSLRPLGTSTSLRTGGGTARSTGSVNRTGATCALSHHRRRRGTTHIAGHHASTCGTCPSSGSHHTHTSHTIHATHHIAHTTHTTHRTHAAHAAHTTAHRVHTATHAKLLEHSCIEIGERLRIEGCATGRSTALHRPSSSASLSHSRATVRTGAITVVRLIATLAAPIAVFLEVTTIALMTRLCKLHIDLDGTNKQSESDNVIIILECLYQFSVNFQFSETKDRFNIRILERNETESFTSAGFSVQHDRRIDNLTVLRKIFAH